MNEHREDQASSLGRPVQLLTLPSGPVGAATLFDRLADALAGSGPTLALAPAGDDEYAHRIRHAVGGNIDANQAHVDADIAMIVSTSGSLGQPKGVLLPASALLASAHAAHDLLGGPGSWLLAVPVTSVAGAQVLVRSLVSQTEPVVLSSIGGAARFDPAEFTRKAWTLDHSLPAYCSLVPTQLARILEDPDARSALQGFDAVLIGGARLAQQMAGELDTAFVRWFSTYGMTETSGGLFYNGCPLRGAHVELQDVDETGAGRIVVGGPMVARGYLNDPASSATAFVGGAHITSDLGRIVDGRLEVIGRIDDVVQIGGVNVALGAVEDVIARHCAAVAVLAGPDETWGSVLTAYVSAPTSPEGVFLDEVETILGRAARPQRVVTVPAIPHSPNGKPDREALMRMANDT